MFIRLSLASQPGFNLVLYALLVIRRLSPGLAPHFFFLDVALTHLPSSLSRRVLFSLVSIFSSLALLLIGFAPAGAMAAVPSAGFSRFAAAQQETFGYSPGQLETAYSISPLLSLGSQRCFCSSVP